MLHDLTKDDGYAASKQAAEATGGHRHRGKLSKTCSIAKCNGGEVGPCS